MAHQKFNYSSLEELQKDIASQDLRISLSDDFSVLHRPVTIEPCNSFPYGRGEQQKRGNAQYLNPNESIEFVTKVKIKEL